MKQHQGFYVIPGIFWFWKRAITLWLPWWKKPRECIPAYYVNARDLGLVHAHESVHVAQWEHGGRTALEGPSTNWLRVRMALRYLTPLGKLTLEAEAFAGSVRWHENLEGAPGIPGYWVNYYAEALQRQYGSSIRGMSLEKITAEIRKYLVLPGPNLT